MKRKTITIISVLAVLITASLLLSSCINFRGLAVKGSGKITSRAFDVSDFDSVNFSGIGKIEIDQGKEEKLFVEAEENIIDKLDIKVRSQTLYIGMKKGYLSIIPTKDIIFKLTIRDIKDINLSGAGSITGSKDI